MDQTLTADPRSIVIRRDTRQRQGNIADVEDLKQSIAELKTLINPIVVRRVGDETVLIAGERRLRAYLELGLTSIPIRFLEALTEEEAEVIELEENIKRKDLPWRDQVRAAGRLHAMFCRKTRNWQTAQTAKAISIHPSYLNKILKVHDAIDSNRIAQADSLEQAYNILVRFAERKAESIVSEIASMGASIFSASNPTAPPNLPPAQNASAGDFSISAPVATFEDYAETHLINQAPSAAPAQNPSAPLAAEASDPILCANFLKWAAEYSGPKFTLIHCDFPYGNYRGSDSSGALSGVETDDFYDNHEEIYWDLLRGLTSNLDRIMSYSAHLIFWFNMNFYTETVSQLRKAGLFVHDHPLIWAKTDGGGGGRGVVPGTAVTYPRRMYDTALLAVRGNRPLAKPGDNRYAAPTVGNKIHPSQKPEPMLRHFLSMVVDETTTVLDPTCGSGAALRAAEDLGAKSILGLELDPNYVASANARTKQARILRAAGALNRSE